jgi:hypothetical protein
MRQASDEVVTPLIACQRARTNGASKSSSAEVEAPWLSGSRRRSETGTPLMTASVGTPRPERKAGEIGEMASGAYINKQVGLGRHSWREAVRGCRS